MEEFGEIPDGWTAVLRHTRRMAVTLAQRLLRVSLFTKILLANSVIFALGSVVGTYVTVREALETPQNGFLVSTGLFVLVGFALSVLLNALVLRTALRPLARLERAAHRVREGDLTARVALGAIGDPDTDQLAASFNAMVDGLRARTEETEAYSTRLRELSDRVLVAQEDERHRLAAELHDETGQSLSSLLLGLRLFRDTVSRPDVDREALARQASDLADLARDTLDGVRRLALELRPRMLDDLGLVTALRAYVDEWTQRTRITVRFDVGIEPHAHFPAPAEIAIYRMVQEALINVAKHAGATSVTISLHVVDNALVVEVRDNGRGISLSRGAGPWRGTPLPEPRPVPVSDAMSGAPVEQAAGAASSGHAERAVAGPSAGLGLFSIQERINLAGGRFEVRSAPGQGTALRAVIPLPDEDVHRPEELPTRSTWTTVPISPFGPAAGSLLDPHGPPGEDRDAPAQLQPKWSARDRKAG